MNLNHAAPAPAAAGPIGATSADARMRIAPDLDCAGGKDIGPAYFSGRGN